MDSDEVWTLVKTEMEALYTPFGVSLSPLLSDPAVAQNLRLAAVTGFRLGQDHAADRMEKAVGSGG